MKAEKVMGESSWTLHSDCVSAALTRNGGHVGPVEFELGGRVVAPMHVAPWAGQRTAATLMPILRVLRGDFFCMPFGGNTRAWHGEKHPVHGETANGTWSGERLETLGKWTCLRASMETNTRPARVEKMIALRAGDPAVYSRHVISGARGPMCLGHHAMLNCAKSPIRLSASAFVRGQVFPHAFENPAEGGYSSLKPGGLFKSLAKVPLSTGGYADLSRFPAREGFEDLVMISSDPRSDFAWTAAVFSGEGYLWFTLRDPRVLASTVLWHSNGGRHYAPWNGRHRGVIGIEDVTAYFHCGLADSAGPNPVNKAGIPTSVSLEKAVPVNSIFGVASVPRGFDVVEKVLRVEGGLEFVSPGGKRALVSLDSGFLYGEERP